MIDYCGQICYSSVFFNDVFELWTNFMFWFENFGFGYVLVIMMLCFYVWSSLYLCFLLIRLKFWMIFDDLCA